MRNLKKFESNDERSEMIAQLCEMGYDQATCDTMSYEELCDCMQKELSKEDSEYGKDEYMGENVFKNVGKLFGIKSMSTRVDSKLGFNEEDFKPTRSFKSYLSQAEDRNSIPSFDMVIIEKALRKAREIGYGISMMKDEPDLTKMQGTEEEKEIAKYFIKRALYSIHSTSGGGHEFGQKPTMAMDDNATYSNLKHLKSFESFKSK